MYRLKLFCLLVFVCLFSSLHLVKAQTVERSAIPVLKIDGSGETTLKISKLTVDIVVTGNIATTTFDITFYNHMDRILEGEFDFPLADGQNISRYALEINGHLREGVVVEKAKAREAFENTVRRGIDPGLAEKTKGNNFRTRIYPIPAKGYKRVVIGLEQTLGYVNKDMFYSLPLYNENAIDSFSIKTTVLTNTAKPALQDNLLNHFNFNNNNNTWIAEYKEQNFVADNTIAFTIPFGGNDNDLLYTETLNGATWFYLHAPMQGGYESKPAPTSVLLLWDVSASGAKRSLKKETALIERYMAALKNVTVTLIPFNIKLQRAQTISITNGDASGLINRLKQLDYDGGTQLGAIDLQAYHQDEILLFSDGLSTFGKSEIGLGSVPVTAINSSSSADFSYLKFIALKTHGKFIDLTKTEPAKAVEELVKEPLRLISATYDKDKIDEVYTETGTAIHNGFSVAGMLKKPSATLTLNFGYGNNIRLSKDYVIELREQAGYENIKHIWAGMKIAQLDLRYEKNKELITQLGKEFSVVTQNTSLLVLDRVEDYVENEIIPPAELMEKYNALIADRQKSKVDKTKEGFDEGIKAMKELKEWWNKKLEPKPNQQAADSTRDEEEPVRGRRAFSGASVRLRGSSARSAPQPNLTNNDAALSEVVVTSLGRPRANEFDEDGYTRAFRNSEEDNNLASALSGKVSGLHINGKGKEEEKNKSSAIQLAEWKADVPYLKILEATPRADVFEKYMQLRKTYQTQPSFYVDVAGFFFQKKNKDMALQVLSNAAEMDLESAELLRIVANQLLENGETDLAIETFKQVMKLREEEPQSYRDLALAYNEAGMYDEAVRLLYKIVIGKWDSRFRGLKRVELNEMNAIISAHPNDAVSTIDPQFIAALPVDVRIVIGWSSDNADVDLWVVEPGKEKCFYQHQLTSRGGSLSGDITQGYGPEEYIIKTAPPGDYEIEANLYGDQRQTLGGPITVKAELFTDFGRPTQKRKVINFRVNTKKEVVTIGSLKFGN